MSRHGISVDPKTVEDLILIQLAGKPDQQPKGCLDLRQLVAILVIPELQRTNLAGETKHFESIWNIILTDVVGQTKESPELTIDLIQDILDAYGETAVPTAVLQDMLQMCRDAGTSTLTVQALQCALTSDLAAYNVEWGDRLSTFYDDVMKAKGQGGHIVPYSREEVTVSVVGENSDAKGNDQQESKMEEASFCAMTNPPENEFSDKEHIRKVFTFAWIDQTADTYRSQTFSALIWVCGVISYFAYVYSVDTAYGGVDCSKHTQFGCKILNGLANWTYVFLQLSTLGTLYIILGSAGNSIYAKPGLRAVAEALVGMVTIVLVTIIAFSFNVETVFFHTGKISKRNVWAFLISLALGAILLIFQILIIIRLTITKRMMLTRLKGLQRFLTPGMAYKELRTKQAATFKINKLLENAFNLHELKGHQKSLRGSHHSEARMSCHGQALMNFTSRSHLKETVGGFGWAWKRFFNSAICTEDGVWFHTRLFACNFSQFLVLGIVACFMAFSFIYGTKYLDEKHSEAINFDLTSVTSITWEFYFNPRQTKLGLTVPLLLNSEIAKYFGMEAVPTANTTGAWFFNSSGAMFFNYNELSAEARKLYNLTLYIPPLREYPIFHNFTELVQRGAPGPLEQLTSAALAGLLDNSTVKFDFAEREVIINKVVTGMDFVVRTLTGVNITNAIDLLEEGIFTIKATVKKFVVETANTVSNRDAYVGIFVGGFAGFAAILGITLVFIPSFVSTVLKFRSGVIPSLHDREFLAYRVTGDQTTILFGSCFWGAAFTGLLCALLVGGIAFLIVWDVTFDIVQALIGQLIGIAVTVGFKMVVMILLRSWFIAAFYRKRPAASNVLNVVLECWNVGLSTGFMLARTAKLLLVTAFYIGRVDTPFLAPGIGHVGNTPMDSYPIAFRKDLLLHGMSPPPPFLLTRRCTSSILTHVSFCHFRSTSPSIH
jgi:hypothetical protein